jgi:hypothetical protein
VITRLDVITNLSLIVFTVQLMPTVPLQSVTPVLVWPTNVNTLPKQQVILAPTVRSVTVMKLVMVLACVSVAHLATVMTSTHVLTTFVMPSLVVITPTTTPTPVPMAYIVPSTTIALLDLVSPTLTPTVLSVILLVLPTPVPKV